MFLVQRSTSASGGTGTSGGGYTELYDLVVDGGCIGDGVADDTAAVVAAIATGKNLYMPAGKFFKLTSGVTLNANQSIYGNSTLGVTSGFKWSASSGYCLTLDKQAQCSNLVGIALVQDSAVTPTSGGLLRVGDATNTNYVYGCYFERVVMSGGYDSWTFINKNNSHRSTHCYVVNPNRYGLYANCPAPYGIGMHDHLTLWASSAASPNSWGMYVAETDTSVFDGLVIAGFNIPVQVVKAAQLILKFDSCENYYTTTGTTGSIILGSGTTTLTSGHNVINCSIENVELYGGVTATSVPPVFIGGNTINTKVSGLIGTLCGQMVDYGYKSKLLDHRYYGNTLGGIAANGIGTMISDSHIVGTLSTGASASNLIITGNNIATASIHANSWASSVIKNNVGIADLQTSIASAPFYVGQFAVVGGIGYLATGTASAADWKQVTN